MDDKVFIVGGGPSLRGFDFSRLKDLDTIVVNKAVLNVPDPNYFITMDFSFFNKVKNIDLSECGATKVFIANLWYAYMKEVGGRIVDTRFPRNGLPGLVYELSKFDMIIKSRVHPEGVGSNFNQFRTGLNSGFCALQFAVLVGYTKIYMLGIDLTIKGVTHYHDGYGESCSRFGEKLDIYNKMFLKGVNEIKEKFPKINLYSCSPISVLNDVVDYIPFGDLYGNK